MNPDYYLQWYCFLTAVWRRRYLWVTPLWVMPLLAILVSMVVPKSYVSSTAILIQEPALLNPFLKDLAIETPLKDRTESLSAILHSRSLLTEVALQLKLFTPTDPLSIQESTVNDLSKNLTVKWIGENVVEISYKGETPQSVVNVLSAVGNTFMQKILYPQLSQDSSSSVFLTRQLALQKSALQEAQQALTDYESRNADKLPFLKNSLSQQLSQLQDRLALQTTELAGASASYKALRDKLTQTHSIAGEIDNKIADLTARLTTLRTRYTDQYSGIQSILKELESLNQQKEQLKQLTEKLDEGDDEALNQLWQRASAFSQAAATSGSVQPFLLTQLNQLQVAQERVRALSEQITNLKEQIKTLQPQARAYGQEAREYADLQRNMTIQQQLYEKLLQRFEMTKVSRDLTAFEKGERIKMIDPPATPATPATPPVLFLLAGIFAGIVVGITLATVAEVTDTSLRRRSRLQAITGVAVLSRVPPLTGA